MYVYVHLCVRVSVRVRVHKRMRMRVYVRVRVRVHLCVCARVCVCVHACMPKKKLSLIVRGSCEASMEGSSDFTLCLHGAHMYEFGAKRLFVFV